MQGKYMRYKVDVMAYRLRYIPFLSLFDNFPERLIALFIKGLRLKGSKYQRDLTDGGCLEGLLWSPWPHPSLSNQSCSLAWWS